MTNIPTLREVLSRVESLKGPLTRGEAEKIADKLFMLSTDRESWLDVVAALGGGRSALGAVVALVEREMPGWGHQVGRPLQTYKKGYYASVFREATESEKTAGLWMPGHFSAGREYGADYSESKMQYFPSPALALLAAYLRARIAEAELAGQRAGKAS